MIFASWLVVDAATRPIWEQFLGLNCDNLVAWDPPSQKTSPGHGPGLPPFVLRINISEETGRRTYS